MTDTLEQAQADGRAPWQSVVERTRDFVLYEDAYPVTEGHLLFVPTENTADNIGTCFRVALQVGQDNVSSTNNNITGFNIGLNHGTSAGQTCMYPHVHLIFRRDNDTENPRGGVRNVIPSKGDYTNE